jgi:internalin A
MTREDLLLLIDKAADEGQTELDWAGLGLEELPPEIDKCTQLESLVLAKYDGEKRKFIGNKLTEFPDVVLQLTNLKILNLGNNQITVRFWCKSLSVFAVEQIETNRDRTWD